MQGCVRRPGKAAGGNRGCRWEEGKGPEPELLPPPRTRPILFHKGKEADLP